MAVPARTDPIFTFEAVRLFLKVTSGPKEGATFTVTGKDIFTIGSHPDTDLYLSNRQVSSLQAKIQRPGQACNLQCLGVLNGWVAACLSLLPFL